MKKVFISSTGKDLKEYREAAEEICIRFGFHPIMMEYFEAMGKGATEGSLEKINQADLYVGIYAHRYGYIEEGYDRSVTELEFDHAKDKGLDCICFIVNPDHPWPPKYTDHENYPKLEKFKKKVNKLIRAKFTTVNDFRVHLTQALTEWKEENLPDIPTLTLNPLHQLPAPPADFTGRQAELAELLDKIKEGGVTITGVRGMGGIGKTALALVLADRLKDDYPDVQLYLDLRGAAQEGQVPVTTPEALAHVIRAFHPTEQLPESQEELQALYNSVLHGQRALLLMDNALDAAQVGPLIPPPGNALLVTSRQKFALPGLYPKDLDTLIPEEARALVQKISPRVDDACTDEIARLCGYLPVALHLAATALAETIDLSPEKYLEDLKEEKKRLKLVDASLSLSVKLLDEELQTRWYALGVFPESFYWTAAMAVWDVEEESVRESLSALVRYSLVDWDEAGGRYKLHDLARVYAWAQLREEEHQKAELRFSAHYEYILRFAKELYKQGDENILQGLTLYDLEAVNIQSGQRWAAEKIEVDGRAARLASAYPDAGVYVLSLRLHARERITWLEKAVAAAQSLDDKATEGIHLGNLGLAQKDLGDPKTAIMYYEQALEIAREIDDRRTGGNIHSNLGIAHAALGDHKTAIRYHEQALDIAREFGDRRNEGNRLGNLGNAHYSFGDPKTAIKYHEQALEIARETGDRRGEGQDLGNLGSAHYSFGDPKTAIKYFEQALEISREIGDRRMEGGALGNLGTAHADLGDPKTAIQYYEQQLEITLEIGDRRGEATASWNLGLVYEEQGQIEKAIEVMQICVDYEKEIGHPDAEEDAARVEELKKGLE